LPDKEEKNRTTFVDRLLEIVLRQALGAATKTAERIVKRTLRLVGLVLAGIVIVVLGVAFLAVGAVRWLAVLMPGWLAWAVVGIVLFLIGITLTLAALVSSRN
jgi:hypothetical protein